MRDHRMIFTFKQFVNTIRGSLFEELTSKQKAEVDTWEKPSEKTLAQTNHYFGVGNHVVESPLEGTQDKSEVHKEVERHLGTQISPEDYKVGKTKDKYGREVKIGGLLGKTKAPSNLVNSFANDTTRQGKNYTGLTVKVSRHPHDVAGQTSSGQSWAQQSCKNFENGCNRRFLKPEVKAGTVVGYLKDDTGREIARATLHPYHNDEGHTAYRVDSHYGINHQGFRDHMEQVAKDLSGQHKGGSLLYKIHPDVYNDSKVDTMGHPNATPKDISSALESKDPEVRIQAAFHPNATSEHISKALDDKDIRVRRAATRNENLNSEHISKVLDDPDEELRMQVIGHKNANSENISKALNDPSTYVREAAVDNKNATSEHISRGLNDTSPYVRKNAVRNPNANSQHISKALDDTDQSVRVSATLNDNATAEHISKALNDASSSVRHSAIQHNSVTPEHISKALNDPDPYVRSAAIRHKNATSEHISKALDDADSSVRIAATRNPNVTSEHIFKALNDKDRNVRYVAIRNNKATSEHISKALDDPDAGVRYNAITHPNVAQEHISKALNDADPDVRRVANNQIKRVTG